MRRYVFIAVTLMAASAYAHVWDELAILARPNSDDTFDLEKYSFLQASTYTNGVFFDYNNDGCLDLLLIGRGGDWNISGNERFCYLYKNLGETEDYRFQRVTDTGLRQATDEGFYNPVSVGDFNHDGYTDLAVMTYDEGRQVTVYLNDHGTGRFIPLDYPLIAATNGSVMFGDLNNDGWLDLAYAGYSDRCATELRTHINNGDGTFSDSTPEMLSGAFQGQMSLGDIDGDGLLDIISCGNGENWAVLTSVFINSPEDPGRIYTCVDQAKTGLPGASRANPLIVDLNADGRMDIVLNGEGSDSSGFRTRLFYQKVDGSFVLDGAYPVVAVNQDGGINMGDYDGDGNMDLIVGGYVGNNDGRECYSAPLRVYRNSPETAGIPGNVRPEAPTDIDVTCSEGMLTITWSEGTDKESPAESLRYNLFVCNNTTGEIYTMIPADIYTGRLKVGTDLQTSLSSKVRSYTIKAFGDGDYTVGVQTLDQAYAPSKFRTADIAVDPSGVGEATPHDTPRISVNGYEVAVHGQTMELIEVFSSDGRLVAHGATGDWLSLPGHGVYVVASPSLRAKLIL